LRELLAQSQRGKPKNYSVRKLSRSKNEREKMTKLVINMAFLFGVLLVAWQLQDNGQHTAGALLLLVSLALAFVLQIEKGTK